MGGGRGGRTIQGRLSWQQHPLGGVGGWSCVEGCHRIVSFWRSGLESGPLPGLLSGCFLPDALLAAAELF